jgi:predicted RNA binding protein YcfA (HicA-like mRNA interferase family)
MKKEIKELVKLAEELGWYFVRRTSDGHLLYRHPVTGQSQTLPSTPNGGKRGLQNAEADLRRKARK